MTVLDFAEWKHRIRQKRDSERFMQKVAHMMGDRRG